MFSVQEEKLSFLRTVCRQVANTLNRKDPDSLLVRLGARQVSIRSPNWTAQLATLNGPRSAPSLWMNVPYALFPQTPVLGNIKCAGQLWKSMPYC